MAMHRKEEGKTNILRYGAYLSSVSNIHKSIMISCANGKPSKKEEETYMPTT
jgi:hypothetical protein